MSDPSSRRLISSGGPWEAKFGYSRALVLGDTVYVSGTTAMTSEGLVGEGDPYAQTMQTLATIGNALADAGATFADVVRYRVYATRQQDWPEIGRALGETFSDARPAGTMVGVSWLLDDRMLVEIDIDAVLGSGARD